MKPFIEEGMHIEKYHSMNEYFSRSALVDFSRSQLTYWGKYVNKERPQKKETPSMSLGSLVHCLILEEDEFFNRYAIEPKKVLLKDVGREAYDAYKRECGEIEAAGKVTISFEDLEKAQSMKESVFSEYKNLLSGCRPEVSCFWQDEELGVNLKARPDAMSDIHIVDIKTAHDALPRAMESEMIKYGYHIQAAMCIDGIAACTGNELSSFVIIAVESSYPFNVGAYVLDSSVIDAGRSEYKRLASELKAYTEKASKERPKSYGETLLMLPKWYAY